MSSLKIKEGGVWREVGGGGGYPLIGNLAGFTAKSIGNNEIAINFTDPPDVVIDGITIATWGGTLVRRSSLAYPVNEKDGELVIDSKIRNQFASIPLVDEGVTDTQYYYMAFPYTEKKVITIDAANRATATATLNDDMWGTPGAKMLIAGDDQGGYFGTVPASQFITGDALAQAIGLTAGSPQFSDVDWLKHMNNGIVQFTPLKAIRYNLSWDDIEARGAVWGDGTSGGDRTVEVQGFTFKVRLFRGLDDSKDPKVLSTGYDGVHCHGSEWNRLMLPLHIGAKNGSWGNYGSSVEAGLPYWGIDFTDQDMLTHYDYGNGSRTWCQNIAYQATRRSGRGGRGAAISDYYTSSYVATAIGWRPVLELVTD